MSTTSFSTTVTRSHTFDQKELDALLHAQKIPKFSPLEEVQPRAFDLDEAMKKYMAGMPASASRWYPHTEWDTSKWFTYNDILEMGYEEAHFWLSALSYPDRYTEHKGMNHTSQDVLRSRDYTKKMSYKEFVQNLQEQQTQIKAMLGQNHYMSLSNSCNDLTHLLTRLVPRHEQIPCAQLFLTIDIAEGYNTRSVENLLPPPSNEKELADFTPQAQALLGTLDPSDRYQAAFQQTLVIRYNLTDAFSHTVEQAIAHTHQLSSKLHQIYYHLPDEEQATFRKKYRKDLQGLNLKVEFAVNGYENLTTWLDIGISHKGEWAREVKHIHAPEAVKYFATLAHVGLGSDRILAENWLLGGGANTVVGLIPLLARRGHARDTAVDILRRFKQQGHQAQLEEIAKGIEEDTGKKQFKELILDWEYAQKPYFEAKDTPDWLTTITGEKGKLPDWLANEPLPAQFTADGTHQLTAEQVQKLVLLLKAQGDTHSHSREILLARKHLSRRELGELSWTIFDAWLKHGANTKTKWAYLAIGHFGTSLEGQKVAPYLKIWPKQNKWRMAQDVLEIYRMIGSDGALMTLNGVAQKVRQKSVRSRAQSLLKTIAQTRGLTDTELADRIIPDCDLDEKGRYTFDYGERKFTLAFDSELKPVLRDETRNKIIKSLPKPGKKDDADLAEDARDTFKVMKKQIKEVISVQLPRLEAAMITGRTWSGEDLKNLIIHHPLMTHFARRLLWGVLGKKGEITACFRVDEDNQILDAEDEIFALAEDAKVILVHPLHLEKGLLETWGTVFGDYEILPPFPQLNRPVYDLEDGEEGKFEITRFAKLSIPGLSLKGFVEKSNLWRRGMAEDAGIVNVFYGSFDHLGVSCVVDMEMGFDVAGSGWSENGGLNAVTFYKGTGRTYSSYGSQKAKDAYKLEDVPKLALSETLYSLYKFTSKYEA